MAFFIVEVDNEGFKVLDTGGTAIDPATQATVAAIETALNSIKDTDGIKKITDALPVGDNTVGRFKLTDGTNLLIVFADGESWTTQHGMGIVARDAVDVAHPVLSEVDGALIVAAKPPTAPPGTTEFVMAVNEAELSVGSGGDVASPHTTESAIIGNTVNLFLQSVNVGTEGDPSEAGAKVEIYWREGAGPTDHLIERIFVAGDTKQITLPNINKARDGTAMTGNGTNTKLAITRTRLSASAQEVDFEIRGFTE
jgi:hypothetical protein